MAKKKSRPKPARPTKYVQLLLKVKAPAHLSKTRIARYVDALLIKAVNENNGELDDLQEKGRGPSDYTDELYEVTQLRISKPRVVS